MHIVFSKCSFGRGHVPWCEGYFVSGGYDFGIDRGGGLEGVCSGITRVWGQSGVSCFIRFVVSAIFVMMGGLLFFFEQAVVSVSLFLLGVYFTLSGVFLGGFEYAIRNLEVGANSVVMVLLVSIVTLGGMVWGAEGL